VGAVGVADPSGQDRRTTAPDRHACGDERDLLSAAHRLPLALSAPRSLSARSTVYNIFRKLQHEGVWERIWDELLVALREQRGREASPTAAIIEPVVEGGGKRGCKSRGEDDAVGYDAGKKVKGRKLHALVDVEGLPLRVVVRSAGMQDRDGAGVVLDKIRQRFPWLELVWADSGYNARQVKDAVAKVPGLRIENRQAIRRHERLRRVAAPLGGRAHLLLVRSKPSPRKGLREPRRHPRHLRHPRRNPTRD
jgi:transposase